jgi:hypothetical protein
MLSIVRVILCSQIALLAAAQSTSQPTIGILTVPTYKQWSGEPGTLVPTYVIYIIAIGPHHTYETLIRSDFAQSWSLW